jgi:Trypsin-like peptidase domain
VHPKVHSALTHRLRWRFFRLLACAALASAGAGLCLSAPPQQKPALPAELQGVKVYHLPGQGTGAQPLHNLVAYKSVSYRDINLERLSLNISVAIQPVDRDATVEKIYFQNVQADGFPVHIATFNHPFQASKKHAVDLPAPLDCSIVYSDLDSVAPLQQLINQDKVTITGESFLEVKVSGLEKMLLRTQRLVIPVHFKEEVPLNLFNDSPFLKLAANKILETLADPTTSAALSLAKAHLAKLTEERSLGERAQQSAYLLYCEYALVNPQTGAEEKFVQYGTAFAVSADGKLLTAKRVVQPWKFDPQIAFLIQHYHLQLNTKAYRLAAWPAGATVLTSGGQVDWGGAFSTDKNTLKLVKTAPDQFAKQEYTDPESNANATLELHVEGPDDAALLQATGGPFHPLALAAGASSAVALLGCPYGLSQPQAHPQPLFVKATLAGSTITLDRAVNPGEAGAPLVSADGKVVAMTGGGKQCIPIASVQSLLQ